LMVLAALCSNRCSATLGMWSLCPYSWKFIILMAIGEPWPVSGNEVSLPQSST
jgi:hypothetical protein